MGTGSVQHLSDVEWCEWSASGLFLSLLRVIGAFCNVHYHVSSIGLAYSMCERHKGLKKH